MGLDYSWTCGIIDNGIESFKDFVESNLGDMLDDCCPLLEGDKKKEFIKTWSDHISTDCRDLFEELRKTNSDMRDQADTQIDKLESEVTDLKSELESAQERIDELEERIAF